MYCIHRAPNRGRRASTTTCVRGFKTSCALTFANRGKRFVERRRDALNAGPIRFEGDAEAWKQRAQAIKDKARELGLGPTFIASALPPSYSHRISYLRWIKDGMQGTMSYMSRNDRVDRRLDPQKVLPGVQSVIVTSLVYWPGRSAVENANKDPSRGAFASYAWGRDYHHILPAKLKELAEWIHFGEMSTSSQTLMHDNSEPPKMHVGGDGGQARWYVDTGAILERSFGDRVGMGFIGKNSMLINPRVGSGFVIGEILTTLPLPPDDISPPEDPVSDLLETLNSVSSPFTKKSDIESNSTEPKPRGKKMQAGCGKCRKCIAACPTGAIVDDRVVDSRKCISYLTIEHRGVIPPELRPGIGNRIFGCDICQVVCPWNKFEWEGLESVQTSQNQTAFSPLFGKVGQSISSPLLTNILKMTEEEFWSRYRETPVARIGLKRLKRNAVIALGNTKDPANIAVIEQLILSKKDDPEFDSPDARIIEHAEWAIAELKSSTSLASDTS